MLGLTQVEGARLVEIEAERAALVALAVAAKEGDKKRELKRNPLKNRAVMAKLNPGANQRRKIRQLASEKVTKQREAVLSAKRATAAAAKKHHGASKEFYNKMMGAYDAKPAAEAADDEE